MCRLCAFQLIRVHDHRLCSCLMPHTRACKEQQQPMSVLPFVFEINVSITTVRKFTCKPTPFSAHANPHTHRGSKRLKRMPRQLASPT